MLQNVFGSEHESKESEVKFYSSATLKDKSTSTKTVLNKGGTY